MANFLQHMQCTMKDARLFIYLYSDDAIFSVFCINKKYQDEKEEKEEKEWNEKRREKKKKPKNRKVIIINRTVITTKQSH